MIGTNFYPKKEIRKRKDDGKQSVPVGKNELFPRSFNLIIIRIAEIEQRSRECETEHDIRGEFKI